jgi:hypothetical protein
LNHGSQGIPPRSLPRGEGILSRVRPILTYTDLTWGSRDVVIA